MTLAARATPAVLALLASWVAAAAFASVFWPMGFDQGVFAWVGDVIVAGGAPYRDAWEVKGPAGFYTYALSQSLFGRRAWGIRVLDLVALGAAVTALWRMLRWRSGMPATALGALLFASLYLVHGYWNTAQPDGWGAMLVLAALAVLTGTRGPWRRLLAGALAGLAVVYKPTFAVYLASLVLCVWLEPATGARQRLLRLLPVAVGWASPLVLAAGWLALHGAWGPFLEIQLGFNPSVHGGLHRRSAAEHLAVLAAFAAQPAIALQLPLAALGVAQGWRTQRALTAGLASAAALAVAVVVAQDKYYPYHWLPLYGPLVALTAGGIAALRGVVQRMTAASGDPRGLARLVPLVVGVAVLAPVLPQLDQSGWAAFVFRTRSPEEHWARYATAPEGGFSAAAERAVAGHLRERTQDGDEVLVFGLEPLLHFLTGRRSPTRFGYSYPLVAGAGGPYRERYRREFLRALRTREPAYVVIHELAPGQNNLTPRGVREQIRGFPEFQTWLRRRYARETTVASFHLWRRRAAGASAAQPPGRGDATRSKR